MGDVNNINNKRFGINLKYTNFFVNDDEILNLLTNEIYTKNKSFIFDNKKNESNNRETIYSEFEEFDIDKFLYGILENY